jgi:ABC-type transport system involved in Fe-S cluster assembly fused permease/ATPase subunit
MKLLKVSVFLFCIICSKSTVIRLLNRFFDPSDGRILVGGHDTRNLSLDSLRQALGIVPQVTHSVYLSNDNYSQSH